MQITSLNGAGIAGNIFLWSAVILQAQVQSPYGFGWLVFVSLLLAIAPTAVTFIISREQSKSAKTQADAAKSQADALLRMIEEMQDRHERQIVIMTESRRDLERKVTAIMMKDHSLTIDRSTEAKAGVRLALSEALSLEELKDLIFDVFERSHENFGEDKGEILRNLLIQTSQDKQTHLILEWVANNRPLIDLGGWTRKR